MDNNNTQNTNNPNKVSLSKEQKTVIPKQSEDSAANTSHSRRSTGDHSYGFFSSLIDKIRNIFYSIITIIVIFVIAGLVTGNLKTWTKNILYYGSAAVHTAKNISLPHRYEKDSPEYILSEYIDALFSGDQYAANQYIDTTDSEVVRATDIIANTFRTSRSDAITGLLVEDMTKANYKISASSTDNAIYSVIFTTYDYQVIVNKTVNDTSKYNTQILLDDSPQPSDEEVALKTLKSYMYRAPKNLKFSITFTIEEKDGSCKIIDFNARELVCAMTGNLVLSLDENYLNSN